MKEVFCISFPFDNQWVVKSDKIWKLANKFDINIIGSGAGFGARDLEFKTTKKSDVKGFKHALKKLGIIDLLIHEY